MPAQAAGGTHAAKAAIAPVTCANQPRRVAMSAFAFGLEQDRRETDSIGPPTTNLGQSLNLDIVTEVVETKEQARQPRLSGCDEAPGYPHRQATDDSVGAPRSNLFNRGSRRSCQAAGRAGSRSRTARRKRPASSPTRSRRAPFGYYEGRITIADVKGLDNAFWLTTEDNFEIDDTESTWPSSRHLGLQPWPHDGIERHAGMGWGVQFFDNLSQGFHDVGLLWTSPKCAHVKFSWSTGLAAGFCIDGMTDPSTGALLPGLAAAVAGAPRP